MARDIIRTHYTDEAKEADIEHFWVTWFDQNGIIHDISTMEEGHLHNLYRWLKDRLYRVAPAIVRIELDKRITGHYPQQFEDMCWLFKQKPECDRMVIHGEPRKPTKRLPDKDPL